jgi:hypothetical protein
MPPICFSAVPAKEADREMAQAAWTSNQSEEEK